MGICFLIKRRKDMQYDKESGVYYFDGNEEDIVFHHMWDCLCDLSFLGFIETVYRMMIKKPPKRYWEI